MKKILKKFLKIFTVIGVLIVSIEEFEAAMGIGTKFDISKVKNLGWNARGFENSVKYISGDFKFEEGTIQTLTFLFKKHDGELKFGGITAGMIK